MIQSNEVLMKKLILSILSVLLLSPAYGLSNGGPQGSGTAIKHKDYLNSLKKKSAKMKWRLRMAKTFEIKRLKILVTEHFQKVLRG
jgi:hypothetical protein